jgi:hypothetical protein
MLGPTTYGSSETYGSAGKNQVPQAPQQGNPKDDQLQQLFQRWLMSLMGRGPAA